MFTVRLAGIQDIDAVVALRMAFLREMQPDAIESEHEIYELTRDYVADKLPKGEFLAWFAEEDGYIIGTGGLVFYHRPPTCRNASAIHAYVLNMYTLPGYRGRGVATAILRAILQHVQTTPAKRVTLHASEMGRSVYEKLGFVASSTEMSLAL